MVALCGVRRLPGRTRSPGVGAVVTALAVAVLTSCSSTSQPPASGSPTESSGIIEGPTPVPTSNGLEYQTASTILARAAAAAQSATSVHVSGNLSSAQQPIRIDMTIAPNGDAHGTLTRSDGTIELTSTGGSSYYRADAAFWKAEAGPQAALLYADKYVFVPSAQSRFASLTDFATFFSTLLTAHGKLSKGHRTHFHGRKVVEVLDGSGGSLFVSVTGVPYPLGGSTGNGGILTLDRWNAPFSVQAPPAIEVITPTPTAAPS